MWADQAFAAGDTACMLPDVNYAITNIIAVGWQESLQDLKQSADGPPGSTTYSPGPRMCGQVYEFRCKYTSDGNYPATGKYLPSTYAVVVS